MKKVSFKRTLLLLTLLTMTLSAVTGGTIAWFTDSVKSADNTIVAGNLDIEMNYYNGTDYVPVTDGALLDANALWEPGYTDVVYLQLENKGNLALYYRLTVDIQEEIAGINKDDASYKLSDYVKFTVVERNAETDGVYATRAAALEAAGNGTNLTQYSAANTLLTAGATKEVALIVFMPTTVDNVANAKTPADAASIKLSVKAEATQYPEEWDAFGKDYDAGASAIEGAVTVPVDPDGVTEIENVGGLLTVNVPADAVQVGYGLLSVGLDDAEDETNLLGCRSIEFTLVTDGVEQTAVEMELQAAANMNDVVVTHNGEVVEEDYDKETGVITFSAIPAGKFEVSLDPRVIVKVTAEEVGNWSEFTAYLNNAQANTVYDFGGMTISSSKNDAIFNSKSKVHYTVRNLTLKPNSNAYFAIISNGAVDFENCTINGKFYVHGGGTGENANRFLNCTFQSNINIETLEGAIFENCTFTYYEPFTTNAAIRNWIIRDCKFTGSQTRIKIYANGAVMENILFENNTVKKDFTYNYAGGDAARKLHEDAVASGNFVVTGTKVGQ